MSQEAKAGGRKAAGNQRHCSRLLRRGRVDNWPDTGLGARARKRADVRQVSLWGNADKDAGTEGQVRRDDGLQFHHPGLGRQRLGAPGHYDRDGEDGLDSERTGGPAPQCARPVGED